MVVDKSDTSTVTKAHLVAMVLEAIQVTICCFFILKSDVDSLSKRNLTTTVSLNFEILN